MDRMFTIAGAMGDRHPRQDCRQLSKHGMTRSKILTRQELMLTIVAPTLGLQDTTLRFVCSIYLFYHATSTDTLQVVWGSVTKIGCGYIYRVEPEDGKHPGWYRETVVCNYCKGGNMAGSKMYITGTAGSACPADHPNNKDGLCAE